ncbi:MAG: hypothetical protein K2N03_01050 [Muribaculaceae bacterium]|nr:hypothetical protein [Muribaculaceae bacterium]
MNKLLFSGVIGLATLACSFNASAEYDYLRIRQTDGSETIIPSENLSISFSDGKMNILSSEGVRSFELSSLASMNFSDISSATPLTNNASLNCTVWSLNGVFQGEFPSPEAARIALDSDIYIVIFTDGTAGRVAF